MPPPLGLDTDLARRVWRRLCWAAARPRIRARQRAATRRRLSAPAAHAPAVPVDLGRDLQIVVSHRVPSAERLEMLQVVTGRLAHDLDGATPPIRVADASDEPWGSGAAAAWASVGDTVSFEHRPESMPAAFLRLTQGAPARWTYLQFDDMVTVGLRPAVLEGACAVLATGLADVVCPFWPQAVHFDAARREVEVVPYLRRGTRYQFTHGRARPAVATLERAGTTFAVFENFTYGFFLNHLVTGTADFAERLAWYVAHVSATSAHAIELAGAGGRGPVWTHVAVPIGTALVDLDHVHTSAAVRAESPDNRRLLEAVRDGWSLRVSDQSRTA